MTGWIKLHRSMLSWEWYGDINVCRLFIHMLLIANVNDNRWQGEDIPRGSFISSYAKLSDNSGLSIQQTRTALSKLKSTGEITVKQHSKYSVFTITNYDLYQADNTQDNSQITGDQHADQQPDNRQATTTKEYKNNKETISPNGDMSKKEAKHKFGAYKHVLLSDKEHQSLVDEYGADQTQKAISFLDEYIEMKGYKARSHYLCIRKWVFDAIKEDQMKQQRLGSSWQPATTLKPRWQNFDQRDDDLDAGIAGTILEKLP